MDSKAKAVEKFRNVVCFAGHGAVEKRSGRESKFVKRVS